MRPGLYTAAAIALLWLQCGCEHRSSLPESSIPEKAERAWEPPEAVRTESVDRGAKTVEARELIRASNAREFGDFGYRKVRLELRAADTVLDRFVVVNVWRRVERDVRMFFYIVEPVNLRGACYLVREHGNGFQEMDVHILLPLSKASVLRVESSNFEDGLLGSDFSYFDTRVTFPGENADFDLLGTLLQDQRPSWVLECRNRRWPWVRDTRWHRAVLTLDPKSLLLTSIDYYRELVAAPIKRVRVLSVEQRDGIWTPTRLLAYRSGTENSLLTLLNYDCDFQAAAQLRFVPEELSVLGSFVDANGL